MNLIKYGALLYIGWYLGKMNIVNDANLQSLLTASQDAVAKLKASGTI